MQNKYWANEQWNILSPILEVTLESIGDGFALNNGSTRPTLGDKAVDFSETINDSTGATGSKSFAEGSITTASGDYSHAEGSRTTASGWASHAEGDDTTASGSRAHAEGGETTASGYASHAEGRRCVASGESAHTEGFVCKASGESAHAEGYGCEAFGDSAHAEGSACVAFGDSAHAEGSACVAGLGLEPLEIVSLDYVVGSLTLADVTGISVGDLLKVTSGRVNRGWYIAKVLSITDNSLTLETATGAPDDYRHFTAVERAVDVAFAHAEGDSCEASGESAHAEGYVCVASGYASHAEGYRCEASESSAHAEGYSCKAFGDSAHAEGQSTTASGEVSHAEGNFTTASGSRAHAEGDETTASGENSHAEGNLTTASGENSHAEGKYAYAIGLNSHAEGNNTNAHGIASHAEGRKTYTYGNYAHTEGDYVYAYGLASHAEGSRTNTYSAYSHAEGYGSYAGNDPYKNYGVETADTVLGSVTLYDAGNLEVGQEVVLYLHIVFEEEEHFQEYAIDILTREGNTLQFGEPFDTELEAYAMIVEVRVMTPGDVCHAEGYETAATGHYSHSQNIGTVAEGYAQTTIGAYNIAQGTSTRRPTDHVFIIGNGILNEDEYEPVRSNALTVDWTGNLWTAGTQTTTQFKLSSLNAAPVSAADVGVTGEIRVTADYIFVCVATNTWKRTALTTW